MEWLEDRTLLATFTVVTAADTTTGPMSLRQAIILGNKKPDTDTIRFQIGTGPKTIYPTSPLPAITGPVILDATTQPGYKGIPLIELNGSRAPVVRGQPAPSGLVVATGNSVVRGFVVDQWAGFGIRLATGGTTPNNRVGNNVVWDNYVGLDPTGTVGRGNKQGGIQVFNSWNNLIGGPGHGNVISANGTSVSLGAGISIAENYGGSQGTVIKGNRIGTDVTGRRPLGNTSHGITAVNIAGTTIGGVEPGAGNLISANGASGVSLDRSNAVVQGNLIGAQVDAVSPLGNRDRGVIIGGSSNSLIGGTTPGAGNTIAFNYLDGVAILSGVGNTVLGNSIFGNRPPGNVFPTPLPYLPIDLGPDGPTRNDDRDPDVGANNLQNYPVLTSATTSGPVSAILGTLNSTPNTAFRIEFFSGSYIGHAAVGTDASGNGRFIARLPVTLTPGQGVFATASHSQGNTSEFSGGASVQVDTTAPTIRVPDPSPNSRSDGPAQLTIVASEPIDGLDLGDLILTRDGGPSLLTPAQTLTTADNVTWNLGNLGALTARAGVYRLVVRATGSGIADLVGHPLAADAQGSWTTTPAISIADATALEPASGTAEARFRLSLTVPSDRRVRVHYATADGTARVGSDYDAAAGTVAFEPGQTEAFVPVLVRADAEAESAETFVVTLDSPADATLARARAIGTILNSQPFPFLVNQTTRDQQTLGKSAIALDARGNFVVTWSSFRQDGSGYGVYARLYNADQTPRGGEFQVNVATNGDQWEPAVAMDAAGNFIIVWSSDPTAGTQDLDQVVYARRFNASGVAQGGEFRVSPTTGSRRQWHPSVAADRAGNFIIAWHNEGPNGNGDVFAKRYDASGRPLGGEFRVAAGQYPVVAMNAAGEFTIGWTAIDQSPSVYEFNPYIRMYSAAGTPKGDAIRVNATRGGTRVLSSIAMIPSGDFVVAWESGTTGYARRFNAAGFPLGLDFRVGVSDQASMGPTVAAGPAGDFAIIWRGNSFKVFARRFAASGVPREDEFEIAPGATLAPTLALAQDSTGTFTAIWTAPDGDSTGVYGLGYEAIRPALPPTPTTILIDDRTVNEADGKAVFTVRLKEPIGRSVTVHYATADGTAVSASDYTTITGDLSWPAWDATPRTIIVPILNDTLVEPVDEIFLVNLSNPVWATLPSDHATGTIADDEAPTISIGDRTVNEADGQVIFTLTLSATRPFPVSVSYATFSGDGTQAATSRVDYEYTSGIVTFAPGQKTTQIAVPILQDTAIEPDEFFGLRLSDPVNAKLAAPGFGAATIRDDDVPSVSISDGRGFEGNPGAPRQITYDVTLSKPSPLYTYVDLRTSDGTAFGRAATGQKQDYSPFDTRDSSSLTFAPGVVKLTGTIFVLPDTDFEPDEYLNVTLYSPRNAALGRSQGRITILNDDQAPPGIGIADTSVEEGDDGTHLVRVPVFLTGPAAQTVLVDYQAYGKGERPGLTATSGVDFFLPIGTVIIPAGSRDGYAEFAIQGDRDSEGDETFLVHLSNPRGAAITLGDALVTILNDDVNTPRPAISIAAGPPTAEGNVGTRPATFTIYKPLSTDQRVTVAYHTVTNSGTATEGIDYEATIGSVTFEPGDTAPKSITVAIRGDTQREGNETFTVALLAPTGGAVIADGQGAAVMTILDDDSGASVPALSIEAGPPVLEGNSGTRNAIFTVRLSSGSSSRVTVNYSTLPVPGTASPGVDYDPTNGTVSFEAGDTAPKTITVPIRSDTLPEADETFFVALSNPTGGVVIADGQGQAIGTILDDDPGAIAPPALSVEAGPPVTEGNGEPRNITFIVRLSSPSRQQVAVSYRTSDDTAKAGADYSATSGTVTFAAGDTAPKTITVPIRGDTLPEADETFFVSLNTPFNAVIKPGAGQASGTILDDDRLPDVVVTAASRVQGEGLSQFKIDYTVSGAAPSEFRISLLVSDDGKLDRGIDTLLVRKVDRGNGQIISIPGFSIIPESMRQPNPDGSARSYSITIDFGGDAPIVKKSFYLLAVADEEGVTADPVRANNVLAVKLAGSDPLDSGNPLTHAQPDDPTTRLPGLTLPEHGTSFVPANTLNFGAGRSAPVQQVVLHAMAGTMAGSIGRFQEGTLVSAHYLIDQDGNTVQMVPEQDTAFHASPSNSATIGIELEDRGHHETDESWITPTLMSSTVDLVRSILKDPRYSIGLKHPSGQVGPGAGGIIAHGQVLGHTAGKTDPKTWPWPEFMQRLSGYAGTLVPSVGLPDRAYTIDWGPKIGMTLDFQASGINIRSAGTATGQRDEIWSAASAADLFIPVHVRLGTEDRLIGYVTGSLSMSLFRPGSVEPTSDKVFLNGPPDITSHVVRWATPGLFLTDPAGRPVAGATTGPLTYWAVGEQLSHNGAALGQLDQALFPEVVRAMADLAHRAAIDRLVSSLRLGALIDPGRTNMLVTAPDGSQTGALPSGQIVAAIPNSYYFAQAPAVLLINPPTIGFGFGYVSDLTAQSAGDFLLLAGSATFPDGANRATVEFHIESGTLAAGETAEFVAGIDQGSVDLSGLLSVTTTDDFGRGSLRQAILDSNARPGRQTIRFAIPGPGVHTISPASPLPTITDPVVIDGTSQPGFAGTPVIELDGSAVPASPQVADGLRITAGYSTVRSLTIDRFTGSAIRLDTGGNNRVVGSFLGTDPGGTRALGNSDGILIWSSPSNTIGGTNAAERNVISGNAAIGVEVVNAASTGNRILGNRIGTDLTGSIALANQRGILINGAPGNTVGGSIPGAGNVLSGNGIGLQLADSAATGNLVQGNLIGTDASGSAPVGNFSYGVLISIGASRNTIGGSAAGTRNVISGNTRSGLSIVSPTATGNVVAGNYVGTDLDGGRVIGNGRGIVIDAAPGNTIGGASPGAGNLISGNDDGIDIQGAASGNVVQGNRIGTDRSGAVALGNRFVGVYVSYSPGNTIGGSDTGAGNVISGNSYAGIELDGDATRGNLVQGNRIGTDATGLRAIGNGIGVEVSSAFANAIGGTAPGECNLISGNTSAGVKLRLGSANNLVQGNLIGTDATGRAMLATDQTSWFGVNIEDSARNTIGGAVPGARNVISGNGTEVQITGGGARGNVVQGNLIGTDITGSFAIHVPVPGVGFVGVAISSASGNTVGGTTPEARNIISEGDSGTGLWIISFPSLPAATGNLVQGNFIGTDITGMRRIGNDIGVEVNASANTIGGTTPGAGNVISGSVSDGMKLDGSGNRVLGNFIGTDAAGMAAIPNGNNGIDTTSASNTIGGTTPGAGNLISGNRSSGIQVFGGSAGLIVQGNFIGTDVTGTRPLGNGSNGVSLYSTSGNTIGGIGPVAGNVIAFNGGAGVAVVARFDNALGTGNAILSNAIFGNAGPGIDLGAAPGQSPGVTPNDAADLDVGANGLQNFPVLTDATSSASGTRVRGIVNSTPNTTFRVQFFSSTAADASDFGEGQTFLAAIVVTTDKDGNATFTIDLPNAIPASRYITATATDPDNNTSEFSKALLVTTP